eukprot:CAMPEP_0202451050 /NCGR_PEP_ID=MMETSP1360-20130828/9560_1 /ASSEMBLY_ACC=CAM_ASM_000848 /TAXON_ID=515479 /ORGANISM="Licmophora paradoxa, Strain CCMP2313" /LENGTH=127 /DNA_ID=CAMNT_0049069515 /DNA_START=83 /DNA_END=463 /DNA_ORIENTATION=+
MNTSSIRFALLILLSVYIAPSNAWSNTNPSFRVGVVSLMMQPRDENDETDLFRSQLERTYVFEYQASDSTPGWSDVEVQACGDDCEECEIPDEYKISDEPQLDVMSFLGIKRAEPLRVKDQINIREW